MDLQLINDQGQPAATFAGSDALFARDYNEALIHQLVVAYQAIGRQGTRAQTGRADILMSDLGMVNRLVALNPNAFERGFMIVTDYKVGVGVTKNNKDLSQAILDGLLIMKAEGTDKAMFEKYSVDYGLARTNEILTK